MRQGGMAYSIGFWPNREEYRGGNRWLMDISLFEASVVFAGCNPSALIVDRPPTEDDFKKMAEAIRRLNAPMTAEEKMIGEIEAFGRFMRSCRKDAA